MEVQSTCIVVLFVCSLTLLGCVFCKDELAWDHHVYTGKHLDDYLTTTKYGPPNVTTNTLFIMYKPSCEKAMEELLELDQLPPMKYMALAKHDYETFPKVVWYHLEGRNDLVQRYNPQDCLKIMYFRNGSTIHNPQVYDVHLGEPMARWVWRKLTIRIRVVNARRENILVGFNDWVANKKKNQSLVVLQPGESKQFYSFVSSILYVLSTSIDKVLYARLLESDFPRKVIIDGYVSFMNHQAGLTHWLKDQKSNVETASSQLTLYHCSIAFYYLLSLNQANNLPRFTEMGYFKTKIPNDLYKQLLEFYFTNADQRTNETRDLSQVAINYSDIMCTLVELSEEMREQIEQALLPIVENFCDCSLQRTYIFGIREYYKRNVLRNHVDRIDTHVVSAILQIHKDLDGAEDWPLEIVGMDGHVRQIYLQPGDMLLYESTTLIHGRPSPFQGNLFANIFAHFKPTSGWDWVVVDGNVLTKDGVEPVCIMNQLDLTPDNGNSGMGSTVKVGL